MPDEFDEIFDRRDEALQGAGETEERFHRQVEESKRRWTSLAADVVVPELERVAGRLRDKGLVGAEAKLVTQYNDLGNPKVTLVLPMEPQAARRLEVRYDTNSERITADGATRTELVKIDDFDGEWLTNWVMGEVRHAYDPQAGGWR